MVQLRQEDRGGRMWNLVGFQTRLRIPEQQRVFRMIPGLADAEFLRFGSHPPQHVPQRAGVRSRRTCRCATIRTMLFAGQLTGVEGYTESTATGLLAGINLVAPAARARSRSCRRRTTMLGALYRYLREADPAHFQPMNANFGLLDELADPSATSAIKRERYASRALAAVDAWMTEHDITPAFRHAPHEHAPPEQVPDAVEAGAGSA